MESKDYGRALNNMTKLKKEILSRFIIGDLLTAQRSLAEKLEGIDNYEKLIYSDLFFSPTREEINNCYIKARKNNDSIS